MQTNPARGTSSDTTTAGFRCAGGCGRRVLRASGALSYCRTCWFVETICSLCGAADVGELQAQHDRLLSAKWRIIELLKRAAPDDADVLVWLVERRMN